MDYHEWLSSKITILMEELEEQLGRDFDYSLEVASGAAKHSEAMMHHRCCYHAPKECMGTVGVELVNSAFADYNDGSIELTMRKIALDFVNSSEHHSSLRRYPVIGCGIAIREIENGVVLFVTLRLRS